MLKKVLGWAVVGFVAFYILTQPQAAASAAHALLDGAKAAATSLGTFISSLAHQ
jgi:hypothetical protein